MSTQSVVLAAGKTAEGLVVRVQGRMTLRESPTFNQFVCQCLDGCSSTRVVVDLSRCEHLDSTSLGCLLILHRKYGGGSPPRFTIAADQPTRTRLFGPTQLDQVLHCQDQSPPAEGELSRIDPLKWTSQPRQRGVHIMETHRELAKLGGAAARQFAQVADRIAVELDDE